MSIEMIVNQYMPVIILAVFTVLVVVLLLYSFTRRSAKRLEKRFALVKDMLQSVHVEKGLEENLDRLLEIISYLIEAPTYTFYTLNKKKENFILKSVRYQSEDFGEVRPSYSSLLSFQANTYRPPLSIPVSKRTYEIKKIIEGEVPLYYIPVGKKGLILVGALGDIKKNTLAHLEVLCEQMSHILEGLITSDDIHSQAQVVMASGKALQKISSISMDTNIMEKTLTKLCVKSIRATGGFLVKQVQDSYQIATHEELDRETLTQLKGDTATLAELADMVREHQIYFIRSDDPQYYQLPPHFAGAGMETIILVRLAETSDSFYVMWYEKDQDFTEDQIRIVLKTMIEHALTVMGHQQGLQFFSTTYLDILKTLARLVDNLNPYTMGYSEMMSRYALVIARQLDLDEEEIKDVVLAAYLSNIGVLGLCNALFDKEGKFTDEEYELMKLHSEVGASIVNVASGNERLADYILYHHERMDGNGYPSGLTEHEIPIGSKIIAVVQTFLAKVYGRKYRTPLPFNESLKMLENAAGAQLDEHIVKRFIEWFDQKRVDPAIVGKPLGKCSEMLCVPKTICEACPVYYKKDALCWEVVSNLCHAHGKSCDTCPVRTEYISRSEEIKPRMTSVVSRRVI